MKYCKKLGESPVYPFDETGKVELWDLSLSNLNEESRKETICLIASLSYGKESCNDKDKLWDYLVKNGHESVFEFIRMPNYGIEHSLRNRSLACIESYDRELQERFIKEHKESVATFKVKVPIFSARQLMRHRSSYLEMSRRYTKGNRVVLEFFVPEEEETRMPVRNVSIYATNKYFEMVDQGVRAELARIVLPLNLYTVYWVQYSYRDLLNFFIYRLEEHAQKETRMVAETMLKLLLEYQPEIVRKMEQYLPVWIKNVNPIFIPAREKRAGKFLKKLAELQKRK